MKALSEKCPAIKFRTLDDGDAPEKYEVSFHLRTIIGEDNGEPIFREADSPTIISIDLSKEVGGYPFGGIKAQCITMPQPYHPNWFESGRWSTDARWRYNQLAEYVLRIAKEIQFEPQSGVFTNDWTNVKAAMWCRLKKETVIFPCDDTIIPDYKDIHKPITIKRKDDVNA